MHGMIDTNGIFQGKYHYNLTPALAARFQSQLSTSNAPGQSMLQAELDYTGGDYSVNVKAINPDITDQATGIYTGSYLQSVTKNVALGVECVLQRMPNPMKRFSVLTDVAWNVAGKVRVGQDGLFTVNVQQLAAIQASYWHRVSDKIELATEWQAIMMGPKRDAVTSISAKFDFKQALIRAQVDSAGKVGLVYEEKLFPGFSLILSGEIDQLAWIKSGPAAAAHNSRWGFGVSLEN